MPAIVAIVVIIIALAIFTVVFRFAYVIIVNIAISLFTFFDGVLSLGNNTIINHPISPILMWALMGLFIGASIAIFKESDRYGYSNYKPLIVFMPVGVYLICCGMLLAIIQIFNTMPNFKTKTVNDNETAYQEPHHISNKDPKTYQDSQAHNNENVEHKLEEMFVGLWTNENPNTRGITKIEIRSEAEKIYVHIWGKCHPTDCDWGEKAINLLDVLNNYIMLKWEEQYVIRDEKLSLFSNNRMKVVEQKRTTNKPGLTYSDHVDYFQKTRRFTTTVEAINQKTNRSPVKAPIVNNNGKIYAKSISTTAVSTSPSQRINHPLTQNNLEDKNASSKPSSGVLITIRSIPDGADIFIDKREVGSTPLTISVDPGAHGIMLAREGYINKFDMFDTESGALEYTYTLSQK